MNATSVAFATSMGALPQAKLPLLDQIESFFDGTRLAAQRGELL